MGLLKLETFRKVRLRSVYRPSVRMLSEIYNKQLTQDHEKAIKQITISLLVFIAVEAIRLAVYQSLLDGVVDWDEILSIIGFLLVLSLLPIKHILYKKKNQKYKKLEGIIVMLFLLGDCALISVRFFNFGPLFLQNAVEGKYDFNLLGFGISIVPNIVISDIVFTKWLEKCVIPICYMLNIGVFILKYQPNNLGALLLKVFTYSLYIFIGFWVREKMYWKVFLHRTALDEWNMLHKEILQNIPENIAVYALDGKILYQNQYFAKLRDIMNTREGESDILSSVINIKRRKNFLSLKTQAFQKMQMTEESGELQEDTVKLTKLMEETPKNKTSFKNLSDVIKFVEKAAQGGAMSAKTCMTFDGQYLDSRTKKTSSMEIKVSLFADISGVCNKIIVILKDTTERDTLALLDSNNKFKDNMLASVSHEIRTPLNGLKSMVEASLYDVDISDDSKKNYLWPAFRSAEMLDSIVNDILDYLTMTRKGLKIYSRNVDIIKIFENCYEIMKIYTSQKKIKFNMKIGKDIPRFMRTDPNRLRQVILNLLSNAFKFTTQGTVVFRVQKEDSCIRVSIEDTGSGMSEETQQKLTNIIKENLKGEKITQQSAGIGLGLTVSYMISTFLGPSEKGGLFFESKEGQGSMFTFLVEDKETEVCPMLSTISRISSKGGLQLTNMHSGRKIPLPTDSPLNNSQRQFDLPIALDDDDDSMSTPDEAILTKRSSDRSISNVRLYTTNFTPSRGFQKLITFRRFSHQVSRMPTMKCTCPVILAVDDEPMNILAMSAMIKRFNCPIDTALSGELGLSIIKKRQEDPCCATCKKHKLIFMDLNMPGIDGFETTKRIRKFEELVGYEKSVIVACTAYLEQEYKQLCFESGMDDFINKPLTQAKLFEILSKSGCLTSTSTQF